MNSKIAHFAAAAVLTAAIGLFGVFLNQTISTAYALEQTIRACHSVRFIHFREYHPGHPEPIKAWVEFREDGRPHRFRLSVPEWDSPETGPKECIWQDGKGVVYLKNVNQYLPVEETDTADKMYAGITQADPKYFVLQMEELQRRGQAEIQIDRPSDSSEPIRITATFHPTHPVLQDRIIASIDQKTKLVSSLEFYTQQNDGCALLARIEFDNYNKPLEPALFTFENGPANQP